MVQSTTRGKTSIYYRQFIGGYAKIPASELRALMEGYRLGHFRRNEVRVFAARWEAKALHHGSPVSLYRIVNCSSKRKGNRRLSQRAIECAIAVLDKWLPQLATTLEPSPSEFPVKPKPVARRVLRHIAQGSSTTVEALFLLAYFMRRIPQRKQMHRLNDHEHYARFRYGDFEEWTGVHRATQSRLLVRLMHRGYLNTVAVHKQNENAFGQLFIDGPMLSIVRPRQAPRREQKRQTEVTSERRSTPVTRMVNSTGYETSTLRKSNPKKEIEKEEEVCARILSGPLAKHRDPLLRRIAMRAAQMTQQCVPQAA